MPPPPLGWYSFFAFGPALQVVPQARAANSGGMRDLVPRKNFVLQKVFVTSDINKVEKQNVF